MTLAFNQHYTEGSDVWTHDGNMRVLPDIVAREVGLPRDGSVLDIGCGAGDDVRRYAKSCRSVVGIDLFAHDAWDGVRDANVAFHQVDFLSFSPSTRFERIVDNGCFHHQHPEDYEAYLTKIRSMLTDDGVFVLSTYKNDNKVEWVDRKGRLHRVFDDRELRELLEQNALRVCGQQDLHCRGADYYRVTFIRRGAEVSEAE